jgi:hypothetical protein
MCFTWKGNENEKCWNHFGNTLQATHCGLVLTCYFRSPDIETVANRGSIGGWGLGEGRVDAAKGIDEEEDEPLDWDQAQVPSVK